ncbi:hypothetical protein MCEMSEM23_01012 [Rhabdaerophilaceae bacterium]
MKGGDSLQSQVIKRMIAAPCLPSGQLTVVGAKARPPFAVHFPRALDQGKKSSANARLANASKPLKMQDPFKAWLSAPVPSCAGIAQK